MGEQNDNAIDDLRASIEQEIRFRTAFSGYDKNEVREYIEALKEECRQAVSSLEAENNRLRAENEALKQSAGELEKQKAEARNEERRKRDAELKMQESLVINLRAANQRLTDDNHAKQLEIADLKEKLSTVRSVTAEGSASLSDLNLSLQTMLNDQVAECRHLIDAWKNEFGNVIEEVNRRVQQQES